LLGLRLRFCLRGKQAGYSNFFFQFNSVFLFWSVFAAATDGKPGNVVCYFKKKRTEIKPFNENNI
jgi:hypothetical protein